MSRVMVENELSPPVVYFLLFYRRFCLGKVFDKDNLLKLERMEEHLLSHGLKMRSSNPVSLSMRCKDRMLIA